MCYICTTLTFRKVFQMHYLTRSLQFQKKMYRTAIDKSRIPTETLWKMQGILQNSPHLIIFILTYSSLWAPYKPHVQLVKSFLLFHESQGFTTRWREHLKSLKSCLLIVLSARQAASEPKYVCNGFPSLGKTLQRPSVNRYHS